MTTRAHFVCASEEREGIEGAAGEGVHVHTTCDTVFLWISLSLSFFSPLTLFFFYRYINFSLINDGVISSPIPEVTQAKYGISLSFFLFLSLSLSLSLSLFLSLSVYFLSSPLTLFLSCMALIANALLHQWYSGIYLSLWIPFLSPSLGHKPVAAKVPWRRRSVVCWNSPWSWRRQALDMNSWRMWGWVKKICEYK